MNKRNTYLPHQLDIHTPVSLLNQNHTPFYLHAVGSKMAKQAELWILTPHQVCLPSPSVSAWNQAWFPGRHHVFPPLSQNWHHDPSLRSNHRTKNKNSNRAAACLRDPGLDQQQEEEHKKLDLLLLLIPSGPNPWNRMGGIWKMTTIEITRRHSEARRLPHCNVCRPRRRLPQSHRQDHHLGPRMDAAAASPRSTALPGPWRSSGAGNPSPPPTARSGSPAVDRRIRSCRAIPTRLRHLDAPTPAYRTPSRPPRIPPTRCPPGPRTRPALPTRATCTEACLGFRRRRRRRESCLRSSVRGRNPRF